MDRTERLALPAGRNWRGLALGQGIDALLAIADACLHPMIVLPLFLIGLTLSPVTVGLAIALFLSARALGRIPALIVRQRTELRTVALLGALGVRALALVFLAVAGAFLGARQPLLLALGIVLLTGTALAGGFAQPLRRESGPRDIPVIHRSRWSLAGALGLIGGALIARAFLAGADANFPTSYLLLFLVVGLLLLPAAGAIFALERPRLNASPPPRLWIGLAAIPGLLLDNLAYGRYAAFRAVYAFGAIAEPFYILYVAQELQGSGRAAGAYLLTLVIARAIAGGAWRALGVSGGNRIVLQLATFTRLLAPITALTLPPLLGAAALQDLLPGESTASLIAFGLVFAAYGVASAGIDLAGPTLQTAITTPRERIAASSVTALIVAVMAFSTVLGGLIVERLGYPFLFIAALLTGLVALFASGLVEEPHAVIPRAPQSERPVTRRRKPARVTSDE